MSKYIYLLSYIENNEKVYKIGFTKQKVEKRVKQLNTGNTQDLVIEKTYLAKNYGSRIESMLHKKYEDRKINREWFLLDETDVSEFEMLCEKYYKNLYFIHNNNTYLKNNLNI